MTQVLIISWVIFFSVYTTVKKIQAFPVIFGVQSKEEFHENHVHGFKWYKDFAFLNNTVKGNDRVLLFDPRAYYLDPDYVLARRVKYMIHLNKNSKAEVLYNYLKLNNVKYIWFDNDKNDLQHYDRELLPLTKKMIGQYRLKRHYFNEVTNSHIYRLYK